MFLSHLSSNLFSIGVTGFRRRYSTLIPSWLKDDFTWWPTFLNESEQRVLLRAALRKLDDSESRTMRRKRKDFLAHNPHRAADSSVNAIADLFLPDEYYQFEEGHYDGVIRRYRETHVSSWAVDQVDSSSLSTILGRLRELHPGDRPTQTHVLHLASDGEILPHIDNTEASGSWIMGVSLGDERVLCMTPVEGFASAEPFEIPLPSGSVYLQKDSVRYRTKHSILPTSHQNRDLSNTQRLSIMIRDRIPINT